MGNGQVHPVLFRDLLECMFDRVCVRGKVDVEQQEGKNCQNNKCSRANRVFHVRETLPKVLTLKICFFVWLFELFRAANPEERI